MKKMMKLAVSILLFALVALPLQPVQAKGLDEGPFFGESVTVRGGETFPNDLVVFGGSVTIEAEAAVNGSVIVIGGSLSANGDVRGDVVVIGGAVSLGERAHITGNLSTIGAPVSRTEGARIDGSVLYNPPRPSTPVPDAFAPGLRRPPALLEGMFGLVGKLMSLTLQSLGFGLLAALLVLFLPQQTRRVGEAIPAQAAWAGAMGLGSFLLFITALVALLLFSILIITLPLTLPLMLGIAIVFASALVLGWVGLGTEIGLRLETAFQMHLPLPLSAGLGTFLLSLAANGLGLIPLIGWVAPTLLTLMALGAVFLTRFGTRPLAAAAQPMTGPDSSID